MDSCVWFEKTDEVKSCRDPIFNGKEIGCEVHEPFGCCHYIKVSKRGKEKLRQKLLRKIERMKKREEKRKRSRKKGAEEFQTWFEQWEDHIKNQLL